MKLSRCTKTLPFLAIPFLVACASKQHVPTISPQACWLEKPVNGIQIGQLGLARDLYIGGETPKTKSRKRAAASLADYLAPDQNLEEALESINDEVDSIQLKGKSVYFLDDVSIDGYSHSYASLSKATIKQEGKEQCLPQTCNITACQPSWLCSPSNEDQLAVLGVSYTATSPVEQHYKSIENALMQAEYMYGVDIEAKKNLSQTNSDYFRYNILRQDSQVNTGDRETVSYAVTDRCFSNGTLFSRVALFGDLNNSVRAYTANNNAWIRNPKHLGFDGAIGSVQKPVASGLMSDQIKLAIKRAAVQLAFEKQSEVSEESIVVQYDNNNYLMISHISEETDVTLRAKVLGIHFKEGQGEQLEVYTWLARVE